MAEDSEEYQRLILRYRSVYDAELLELARQVDGRTPVARTVLQAEMSLRDLKLEIDDPDHPSRSVSANAQEFGRFALLSSPDCIWEFPENEDAQAAAEMLADAGIPCDVVLPGAEKMDMGAPRVAVLPVDAARVRELFSRPIPEEFRILVRTHDEFAPPVCSKCGAADPLLESIEPTNEWRCEVCGNVWLDADPGR